MIVIHCHDSWLTIETMIVLFTIMIVVEITLNRFCSVQSTIHANVEANNSLTFGNINSNPDNT